MRHKFPVLTVKKWLKLVHIYGSYRKNKTGTVYFGPPCMSIAGYLPKNRRTYFSTITNQFLLTFLFPVR